MLHAVGCYDNFIRSLPIASTLVLRLKDAESFLETKIRNTRCEKSRFYPVLAKIRIKNPDKPKSFKKKNVRNHSYRQFCPVLVKIRI